MPKLSKYLNKYALGDGENDAIELCSQVKADALITDDSLAFIVATRLNLKTYMLPDLITKLAEYRKINVNIAKSIMEIIRPRYRTGVIEHNLTLLQEVQ